MKRWIVPITLCLLSGGGVRGDMPGGHTPRPLDRPAPPVVAMGSRSTEWILKRDDKIGKPRLVIPARLVTENQVGASGKFPTIMAGLALTAAFVSAGLCLVRKKRVIPLLFLVASAVVFGCSTGTNRRDDRPPEPPPAVSVSLPATVQLGDTLVLDVGYQPNVELIVPTSSVGNTKP